ncbi:MAG: chemotaxis protein CheB [Pseudobdellovibrionaceae bacterium]
MALTKQEEETVYLLAEKITGASQKGSFRKDVLVRNVERRMVEANTRCLADYLKLVNADLLQYQNLVSDLTIHTTFWFREKPHYDLLKQQATEQFNRGKKKFTVWSAACSTGEEVYSAALILESLREKFPGFEYEVHGSDIDAVSLEKAQRAVYEASGLEQIPQDLRRFVLLGSKSAKGLMTLDAQIRKRIKFFQVNLAESPYKNSLDGYDLVFCRNVLIYFERSMQESIVHELVNKIGREGILILGHSDSFPSNKDLTSIGKSSYKKDAKTRISPVMQRRKRVLIVDDSATVRKVIAKILAADFDFNESDSATAADLALNANNYDLITLDLNMPGENGHSWLSRHRNSGMKIPVVIVSDSSPIEAEKVFGALEAGAQDYIVKSRLQSEPEKIVELLKSLTEVRGHSVSQLPTCRPFQNRKHMPGLLLLGASTGGPESLVKLLQNFPKPCPPVVVVQHISPEFSRAFANRLAQLSGLIFNEIDDAQPLQPNSLYVATGDYHLHLVEKQGRFFLQKNDEPKVNGHRPSVDVLFNSAAKLPVDTLSVLLTGMGKDGAEGLLNLALTNRSFTLAQDEKSSVVFGMPKKAIELGAACFVGDLPAIRAEILNRLNIGKTRQI